MPTWSRVRPLGPHLAVLAAAAALSAWVAMPRPDRLRDHIVGDAGDAMWQLSVTRWTVDALWSLELPWDAPMYFPTRGTYAYSDPMLTQSLVAAPLRALGAGPALVSNLLVVLAWVAATYLAWRLLRRLTGHDALAFVGAVAWACSDLRLATVPLFQLVTAAALVPLVLERLLVTLDRPTWWRGLLLGASVVAAALAALYYGPLLAAAGAAATIAWFVAARRRPTRGHLVAGAVALVVAGAALAPIALRYRDVHERDGLERTSEAMFTARPADLATVSSHHGRLASLPGLGPAETGERALFPGLVVLAAVPAALRLALRRRRPDGPAPGRRADLVAVVVAGAVAYLLAAGIPELSGIRAPARFALLGHLGLVAIATAVLAAVLRRFGPRPTLVAVPVLVAASLLDAGSWLPTTPVPDERRWSAVNEALEDVPPGPVVELPLMRSSDGVAWPRIEAPRLYLARIDGLPRVNGYSGYQPPGFEELAATVNTFPAAEAVEALRAMGVRYVVLRTDPVARRTTDPAVMLPVYGTVDEQRLAVAPGRVRAIRAALPPGVRDLGDHGGATLLAIR